MIKVYGYKKCSTNAKALKYLDSMNKQYEFFDFVANKIDKNMLLNLIKKNNDVIDDLFNKNGVVFKEMNLKEILPTLSNEKKIDLLLSDGYLIKRPLIEIDDYLYIGFNNKIELELNKQLKK